MGQFKSQEEQVEWRQTSNRMKQFPGLRVKTYLFLLLIAFFAPLGNVLLGKGMKERIVPFGRPAGEAIARYLLDCRPTLDKRNSDRLFISRTGKPSLRVERLGHILDWFDEHLKHDD